MSITWVMVANASQAKLFSNTGPQRGLTLIKELLHPESREKTSNLVSDRSGSNAGTGHGAFMQATDPKHHEAERFAQELTRELEQGLARMPTTGSSLWPRPPLWGWSTAVCRAGKEQAIGKHRKGLHPSSGKELSGHLRKLRLSIAGASGRTAHSASHSRRKLDLTSTKSRAVQSTGSGAGFSFGAPLSQAALRSSVTCGKYGRRSKVTPPRRTRAKFRPDFEQFVRRLASSRGRRCGCGASSPAIEAMSDRRRAHRGGHVDHAGAAHRPRRENSASGAGSSRGTACRRTDDAPVPPPHAVPARAAVPGHSAKNSRMSRPSAFTPARSDTPPRRRCPLRGR
jgi:hypothetical protein